MPMFSIVIPTRDRGANLLESVPTVLRQTDPDLELVIQDNCSRDNTKDIVAGFTDGRIRYHRSNSRLSMHDNWEDALDQVSGDYIIYLGDDDALMPDCLETCRLILGRHETDLLRWKQHTYGWNNHNSALMRNRLTINLSRGSLIRVASKPLLEELYRWQASIWGGPQIYGGLVSRKLVQRVRKSLGGYFVDPMPDLSAILLNLGYSDSFLQCNAPLGVIGWSGDSNGGAAMDAEATRASHATLCKEAGTTPSEMEPPGLPGRSLTALILGTLLRTKRLAFADASNIEVDQRNCLDILIRDINDGSLPYEEYVNSIRTYARFLGVAESDLKIPAPSQPTNPVGILFDANTNAPDSLRLDGDALGVKSLREAVSLAYDLTGPTLISQLDDTTKDRSTTGLFAGLERQFLWFEDRIRRDEDRVRGYQDKIREYEERLREYEEKELQTNEARTLADAKDRARPIKKMIRKMRELAGGPGEAKP